MCPCGKAVQSTTHIVGEWEIYKEEQDVPEMREIDECSMTKLRTLIYNSQKTIVILGNRWSPHTAIQTRGYVR